MTARWNVDWDKNFIHNMFMPVQKCRWKFIQGYPYGRAETHPHVTRAGRMPGEIMEWSLAKNRAFLSRINISEEFAFFSLRDLLGYSSQPCNPVCQERKTQNCLQSQVIKYGSSEASYTLFFLQESNTVLHVGTYQQLWNCWRTQHGHEKLIFIIMIRHVKSWCNKSLTGMANDMKS